MSIIPFFKKYLKGYVIHKTATSFKLCKILNEYNSEQDALDDLKKLLNNEVTEAKLLQKFTENKKF